MGDEPLTKLYVEQVFKGLGEPGKGAEFLSYVAPNVHWTVKGTHPLAGVYTSMQAFKVWPSTGLGPRPSRHSLAGWQAGSVCLRLP